MNFNILGVLESTVAFIILKLIWQWKVQSFPLSFRQNSSIFDKSPCFLVKQDVLDFSYVFPV